MKQCILCGLDFTPEKGFKNYCKKCKQKRVISAAGLKNLSQLRKKQNQLNSSLIKQKVLNQVNSYSKEQLEKIIYKNTAVQMCRLFHTKHALKYIKEIIGYDRFIEICKKRENERRSATNKANPQNLTNWIKAGQLAVNKRFSSKAERSLLKHLKENHQNLKPTKGGLCGTKETLLFSPDIRLLDGKVFVEYDGIWHHQKVHKNHDFKHVKMRDKFEEDYCKQNNIKLIRLDYRVFQKTKDGNSKEELEQMTKHILANL